MATKKTQSILVYNVCYGQGINGRLYEYFQFWRRLFPSQKLFNSLIKEIKKINPTYISLQEVDTAKQYNSFCKCLNGYTGTSAIKYSFKGVTRLFQYVPLLRKQGNSFFAQAKYEQNNFMLSHGLKRVVIQTTSLSDKPVTILTLHLSLSKKTRARQLEELTTIINKIKTPLIVVGDFNAKEEELATFLKKTKLIDSNNKMPLYTFPAVKPKMRIDYVLTSPSIRIVQSKVLDWSFSDHKPLFVEFIV